MAPPSSRSTGFDQLLAKNKRYGCERSTRVKWAFFRRDRTPGENLDEGAPTPEHFSRFFRAKLRNKLLTFAGPPKSGRRQGALRQLRPRIIKKTAARRRTQSLTTWLLVARRTGDAWSTSRRSVGPLLVRDNGFRAGRRSDVPPLPLRLFIQKTGRTYDLLFEQCGAL